MESVVTWLINLNNERDIVLDICESVKILKSHSYIYCILLDPNFVRKLLFAKVLILASQIRLFDTCSCARRKIIQRFDKECEKYSKRREKGSV